MSLLCGGPAGSVNLSTGLVFLAFLLVKHLTEAAIYGESCALSADCIGTGITCSSNSLCICSNGYTHISGRPDCEVSVYPDKVFVPDLTFSSVSKFETDMTSGDLDFSRYQEIKHQLEIELTVLFQNVTGFKSVGVTSLRITNGLLKADWTVSLNREDPLFVGASPDEIANIIRPQLEEASKMYKTVLHIDTSRRGQAKKGEPVNKLALGLGLGLSLAALILVLVVVVVAVWCKKRNATTTAKSISDQSSVSCESGRSSKLDPDDYQYSVFQKDGFSIPPHYAKFSPPSVISSSSTFTVTNDKVPLHEST